MDILIIYFISSEALRKYPSIPMLPRVCTENYIIPGTEVLIQKDTTVMIPVHAIQNDPKYFPDPQTFNPDRFGEEHSANQNLFLSFGDGPRHCIGKTSKTILVRVYKFLSKVNIHTRLIYKKFMIFILKIY
jgi:cytochrome P450